MDADRGYHLVVHTIQNGCGGVRIELKIEKHHPKTEEHEVELKMKEQHPKEHHPKEHHPKELQVELKILIKKKVDLQIVEPYTEN
ncbi:hypothetical protein QQ045_031880 [Rhodiola kirilowii]